MPRTAHIPVVMVTALVRGRRPRARRSKAGADDFLTKPVNDIALFARVRSLVRLKMMMDECALRAATTRLGSRRRGTGRQARRRRPGRILLVENEPPRTRITDTRSATDADQPWSPTDPAPGACRARRARARSRDRQPAAARCRRPAALLAAARRTRARASCRSLVIDTAIDARLAKALDIGVNDYLVAPIDRNELLARCAPRCAASATRTAARQTTSRASLALTDELTGLHNRRYMSASRARSSDARKSGQAAGAAAWSTSTTSSDQRHPRPCRRRRGAARGRRAAAPACAASTWSCRFGGEEFVV